MDQYIVSQWFKYKHKLKAFYQTTQDPLYRQCVENDGNLWGPTVRSVCKDTVPHLLKYVINQGESSLNLKLIDTMSESCSGLCADVVFLLRDKHRLPWIITSFFGSSESAVGLPKMPRQKWITLRMHLALIMVQNMRPAYKQDYGSLIALRSGSCTCKIKMLVDLQALNQASLEWYDIECELGTMPKGQLEPLFSLLKNEQRLELRQIMETKYEKDYLFFDVDWGTEHEIWNPDMMGQLQTRGFVKKLSEFRVQGFVAICVVNPNRVTDWNYRWEENYGNIENADRQFSGNNHFIAVGRTLNQLMEDINRRINE